MVRPVDRDEKLNPQGDYSGLDGTEFHGLLIHDPVTLHLVRLCLAATNEGVKAWLLYNVGYALLLSGNRKSSIHVLRILEKIDKSLSALLSSKLSIDLTNLLPDIESNITL
jgi:hypothetical protein